MSVHHPNEHIERMKTPVEQDPYLILEDLNMVKIYISATSCYDFALSYKSPT